MRSNHLSYMGSTNLERETGFEPATPSLEGLCSSQLSYSRVVATPYFEVVERGGFEPPKAEANRFTACPV